MISHKGIDTEEEKKGIDEEEEKKGLKVLDKVNLDKKMLRLGLIPSFEKTCDKQRIIISANKQNNEGSNLERSKHGHILDPSHIHTKTHMLKE